MVWGKKNENENRLKKLMVGTCKKHIYLLTHFGKQKLLQKADGVSMDLRIDELDVSSFPFETTTLSAANFLIF